MSRSYKKPIIKDSPRRYKKSSAYWRRIRRVIKSKLNELYDDLFLPIPREIVNDYDYSDYTSRCTEENCICVKLYGRKKCGEK